MNQDELGKEKVTRMAHVPAKRVIEVEIDDDKFVVWYTLFTAYGEWVRGPSDYSIDSVSVNGQICIWDAIDSFFRTIIRTSIEREHRCPIQV